MLSVKCAVVQCHGHSQQYMHLVTSCVYCLCSIACSAQFYIPQLVQALKYELHDISTVGLFLMARAWLSPALIGIPFYWAMVVEAASIGAHQHRYRVLLDAYLSHCGYVFVSLIDSVEYVFHWHLGLCMFLILLYFPTARTTFVQISCCSLSYD